MLDGSIPDSSSNGEIDGFPLSSRLGWSGLGWSSLFEPAGAVRNPTSSEGYVSEPRRYRKLNSINEMRELSAVCLANVNPLGSPDISPSDRKSTRLNSS